MKKINKKKKIKLLIKAELLLLIPVLIINVIVVCREYNLNPGIMEVNALEIKDKTTDKVLLDWEPVRNTDKYVVSYKEKDSDAWKSVQVSSNKTSCVIGGLKEGASYDFSLRADSEKRNGARTSYNEVTTKKHQKITGKRRQMKLAGRGTVDLASETTLKLSSENEGVAKINDDQSIDLSPGTVTVKATAVETDEFEGEEAEVELEVVDSVAEDTETAKIHTMYKLDESNCEVVLTLIDDDIPQSFDYIDGRYIIAYGMKNSKKIITFDESGVAEYKTKLSIGHPNGFAFSDKGYTVRGWSNECIICDIDNNEYKSISLAHGASGIAYDQVRDVFYTSSRAALICYDNNFNEQKAVAPVTHKGTYYTQDCGGHSGILMRCLSDKTKHGINLIDLYDMVNGLYLGTIECDLSEVEGAAVDEEGYMLLLSNTRDIEDYIYKTPINIGDLGKDLIASQLPAA